MAKPFDFFLIVWFIGLILQIPTLLSFGRIKWVKPCQPQKISQDLYPFHPKAASNITAGPPRGFATLRPWSTWENQRTSLGAASNPLVKWNKLSGGIKKRCWKWLKTCCTNQKAKKKKKDLPSSPVSQRSYGRRKEDLSWQRPPQIEHPRGTLQGPLPLVTSPVVWWNRVKATLVLVVSGVSFQFLFKQARRRRASWKPIVEGSSYTSKRPELLV